MRKSVVITVMVAALGYFVDMFDLTIFGVVRVASLQGIGITDPAEILSMGMKLIQTQMWGMLFGGILWGILGDLRGRLSILFGSIFLYSVANIANAFVGSYEGYMICRLLAGIGLAGELGAAVTLVSELMSKESRGWGTTIVATLGLLGAVAAALIGQKFTWQTAYIVGGSLGFLLLIARFTMADSGMFEKVKQQEGIRRADLVVLFSNGRWIRYLCCILIGVPIWYSTGILMSFAPELTRDLGLSQPVTAGNALLYGSIGLTLGDLLSGVMSQILRSRKKAVALFMAGGAICAFMYSRAFGWSAELFYGLCFVLGTCAGFWAVLVTIAAEQFGTNIRATVATTVPNFVRASLIPLTMIFSSLKTQMPVLQSALIVGAGCFALGALALWRLPETFGADLDYVEERSGQRVYAKDVATAPVA